MENRTELQAFFNLGFVCCAAKKPDSMSPFFSCLVRNRFSDSEDSETDFRISSEALNIVLLFYLGISSSR